ncbi:hypothetical protein AQUCO_00500167v1 [Aquilegia coerulea]|uniref:Uncharacterized protein n=1 Tax=Aquilegia coerulea TaxID=218851 RepID=A0A2G5EQN6_AQUCA|nr:hypothetical protein AQUCO_00500167v1 [Aquilegia coerulea]
MFKSNPDHLQKSDLQIKQDDKFFSRLLSKEANLTNSSFRVYYGGASGAVPFVWESRPGTPKNKYCDTSLPPLTPPPSYQSNSKRDFSNKKPSKFKLIHTIFPKLNVKKSHVSPTSSMSSSSSWSSSMSSSSPSSTPMTSKSHRRRASSLSSFDSRAYNDEEPSLGSPTSTLCFAFHGDRETSSTGGFKGCYSMVFMKNALSSIVGHGSGDHRGTTA